MCSTESIYTLGPHYILISFSALCLLCSQVEEMERIGNQAHNLKRNSNSQKRITKEIRTLHGCGLQYQEDGEDGFTLVVSLTIFFHWKPRKRAHFYVKSWDLQPKFHLFLLHKINNYKNPQGIRLSITEIRLQLSILLQVINLKNWAFYILFITNHEEEPTQPTSAQADLRQSRLGCDCGSGSLFGFEAGLPQRLSEYICLFSWGPKTLSCYKLDLHGKNAWKTT